MLEVGESYFGELGHQRAVLQSEVFLLTVQFPLKHLVLTQQRVHLLQQQPKFTLHKENVLEDINAAAICAGK